MKKLLSIALVVVLIIGAAACGILGNKLSDANTSNEKLTADSTALQAQIDELTAKIATLEGEKADLTAATETAAADATAKQGEIDALTAQVAELTAAGEAAAADAAAKQTDIDALNAQIAALTEEKAALAASAEATAADVAAKQAQIDELTAKVAELEAQVADLTAKVTELSTVAAEAPAVEEPVVEEAPVVEEPVAEVDEDLEAAKTYLFFMYKNAPETTMVDYDVTAVVNIGGIVFPITWTADHESVKFVPSEDGYTVTVDVDEKNPEEVHYILTGTIANEKGETLSVSFNHKVPAALILEGLSYEEIVAAAYTLEDGLAMEEPQRLFGTIIRIPSAYSEQYGNITVDIQIGGLVDMPIQCYRLTGEGVADLKVGDQITVEGILKNYKGTIEFDKGCVLVGMGEVVSQAAYLDAAYALEDGAAMPNPTALEGEIVKIVSEYSEQYGNITVDIVCDGKTEQVIQAYRLTGEGVADLKVGDKIAVYGIIKNYKGTIEFDKGCILIPYGTAKEARTVLSAYTLEDGLAMDKPVTLTGVIVNIPTAYSPDYKNITVDIVVAGMADYQIQCYRLSGEGAEGLAVGDTITVTGIIKNYKGLIEFDKGCTLDAVVKAE